MKSQFPSFQEAIENLTATDGRTRDAFTREQLAAQAEIRTGKLAGVGGILIPWRDPERRDSTTLTATGGTSLQYGGTTVATEVPEIADALRSSLVLAPLGASIITGLTGNADFPAGTGQIAAEWLAETEEATPTCEVFQTLSLSPGRVTASIITTRQMLLQGGVPFYAWMEAALMDKLAIEVERVAINGTGSGNEPTGILATTGIGAVIGGTNGATPDLADLAGLEYAVTGTGDAGRGPLGWLVSPKVRRKLRLTASNGTGSPMLWPIDSANMLLGHKSGVTSACPITLTKGSAEGVCSAIIFGNFKELIVAFWGAGIVVEVVSDAALAKEGKVMVVARAYVDCGVRQPAAFAAMTDALCA